MQPIDRQAILDSLSRLVTPGIKLTALADELGLRKQDYSALRAQILELVEEGYVNVLPGGAFALSPQGRKADPHAKPVPGGPQASGPRPQPEKKMKPTKAAKESRRKPEAKLPWKQGALRVVPPKASPAPREEYDPETGQIRVVDLPPREDLVSKPPAAERTGKVPEGTAETRIPEARGLRPEAGGLVGRITVHPAGYGFVATEEGTVFVPAKYRGTSMDGDQVAVETWPGVRGTEGRVVDVLKRGRARITGILRRAGRAIYLEPDDPRIAADFGRAVIYDAPYGKDGDAIVVEITRYPDAYNKELGGNVLKVLGDPEDPRTEIEKILACAVIPLEFPDDVLAQAKATSQELTPADLADRIDLRDRRFCTIDPETARDFDDALCIEDGPHGGPRVWVAVADVSHYVRWNDPLDREAAIRGVSVYLPDRVIPMLPKELSAGICSLNPLVDRCAMVVRLDYMPNGDIVDIGYSAAAIRSKARLDYPGVAAALEGDFRGRREQYRPWIDELTKLNTLARTLRTRRQARGALELEIAEPKVVLDADDPRLVRDVVKAKGDPAVKQAYELVEEFMIAANEAVGTFFRKRGAPTVWRVHAPPDPDRVAQLAELFNAYGIRVDVEEATTPLGMKAVLDQVAQKPGAQALSFLVLRTLTQAVWDTVPIGHFGLASGDYLHFTSPIRRYPDLLVHRLLKHHLHRDGNASGGGYAKPPPNVETLAQLAADSSLHERRAMEAERESVAMYRAYLMRDQVGQRFEGTVSAVTSFGAFVEIEEPFVEGLIKLDSLGEPMDYDEVHMRLSGKRTGKTIELGDKVLVDINNVSVLRRRIDFTLIATATRKGKPPKLEASGKAGIAQRKKAGREVERAQLGRVERGAQPRGRAGARGGGGGGGGALRLGVSHRGMRDGGGGGGGGRKKGGGGHKGKRGKR
ncbi:MAG TPA: ribonuclease R [Kofleriaceae bacterium]|nr:ribonuclease R [Kofleriaceae bacterium]